MRFISFLMSGIVWKVLVLLNWADKSNFIWTEFVANRHVPQDTLPDLLKSGQPQSPLIFQTFCFWLWTNSVRELQCTWCLASFTCFFVFFYDCIFEQDLFGHVPDTLEVENTNVLDFLQVHLFFTMVLLRCSQLNAVLIKVNNNLLKLH